VCFTGDRRDEGTSPTGLRLNMYIHPSKFILILGIHLTLVAMKTPAFLKKGPPNLSVASDESFRKARRWIDHCVNDHEECNSKKKHVYERPKRLIDVQSPSEGSALSVKLVEQTRRPGYAALSYCWGQDQFKTKKSNLDSLRSGIPVADLSKTVQDAIAVARRLGIRFLWVDCLCIVQDDEQDVATEIGRMADIYQGAIVTIVASSAKSSADGFLHCRPDNNPTFEIALKTPSGKVAKLILEPSDAYDAAEEPTNHRAWCMQESLLSLRLLFFGSRHLIWACRVWTDSDGGSAPVEPTGMPHAQNTLAARVVTNLSTVEDMALGEWRDIVEQYSTRGLSVSADKLPGIAAVASRYGITLQDTYLAGLWKRTLSVSLVWWLENSERRARPTPYRAPTWSWASVDGEIHMPVESGSTEKLGYSMIKILEASTIPASPLAPFGQITSAMLKVHGPMRQMRWLASDDVEKSNFVGVDGEREFNGWVVANADTPELVSEDEILSLLMVMPFQNMYDDDDDDEPDIELCGLILKEVPGTQTMRRLGRFFVPAEFHQVAQSWIQSFEMKEVVMV
jgi:hypothetical protein